MKFLKITLYFFIDHWYGFYVSGHGSNLKYEGLMSKNEATKQAKHWVGIADTIGGIAQVKNIVTGKSISYT